MDQAVVPVGDVPLGWGTKAGQDEAVRRYADEWANAIREHIKSLLPLQLPQVDVEVDFIVGMETEDRQHIGRRPDPQVRALGIHPTGQHGLRPRHRKHQRSFGVLAPPALFHDKIQDRLKSRRSAEYTTSGFHLREGMLTLAKMAEPLDIVWSRPLPYGAQPSTVTVSQDAAGRWYVSLLCDDTITPGKYVGVVHTGTRRPSCRRRRRHFALVLQL